MRFQFDYLFHIFSCIITCLLKHAQAIFIFKYACSCLLHKSTLGCTQSSPFSQLNQSHHSASPHRAQSSAPQPQGLPSPHGHSECLMLWAQPMPSLAEGPHSIPTAPHFCPDTVLPQFSSMPQTSGATPELHPSPAWPSLYHWNRLCAHTFF